MQCYYNYYCTRCLIIVSVLIFLLLFSAKPPTVTSQPKSQMDILPGKTVTFSVQATGTELNYQWQRKQFGKKGEKDEWLNLSREGSTFQEMGTELKLIRVEACNAGYYRCVVSNSAGRTMSLCALLTVGKCGYCSYI